jgi:hypothetical protein
MRPNTKCGSGLLQMCRMTLEKRALPVYMWMIALHQFSGKVYGAIYEIPQRQPLRRRNPPCHRRGPLYIRNMEWMSQNHAFCLVDNEQEILSPFKS